MNLINGYLFYIYINGFGIVNVYLWIVFWFIIM